MKYRKAKKKTIRKLKFIVLKSREYDFEDAFQELGRYATKKEAYKNAGNGCPKCSVGTTYLVAEII